MSDVDAADLQSLKVIRVRLSDRMLGRAAAAFPVPKRRGGSVDRGLI
jgi:hypothetical protein